MARAHNEALWAEWRDRVARFERRTETCAEFCRRVEIELPNGVVVRLTGDAERLLGDAITVAGALRVEA